MPARYDDGALHFERRLHHPVEKVWRAVSDPAELGHWFPCAVEVGELRVGAPLRFVFPDDLAPEMEGEVLEHDPPRRLAFLWGEDELRFELEPDGDGTLLRFTHVLDSRDKAARDAAGWEICLGTLEQRLGGESTQQPGTRPSSDWRAHYEAYERLGFPTGAPVPD